jgi:hypothetical protein
LASWFTPRSRFLRALPRNLRIMGMASCFRRWPARRGR